MSDPVSNSEIEDVLASIRRLVSENAKALKRDSDRDPEAEKLVLTPAFRIDEKDTPPQAVDVFAVDTETWNDASGLLESTENTGFSFVKPETAEPETVDEDIVEPTPDAGAGFAPEAEEDAPGEEAVVAFTRRGNAAGEDNVDEPAAALESDAAAPEGAESVSPDSEPDSPSGTALERRIAELEAAVDLHDPAIESSAVAEIGREDEAEEPHEMTIADAIEAQLAETAEAEAAEAKAAAEEEAGEAEAAAEEEAGAEEERQPGDEFAAEPVDEGPAPSVETAAPEGPPRSWIEGLVAAAASAEVSRRSGGAEVKPEAKALSDVDAAAPKETVDEAVDGGEEPIGAPETDAIEADADTLASAEPTQTDGLEPTDAPQGDAAPDSAESEAEELDDTQLDHDEEAALSDLEALDALPEVEDEVLAELQALDAASDVDVEADDLAEGEFSGGGDAIDGAETTEVASDAEEDEGQADTAEAGARDSAETKPTPERNWVDRLIAAAATLGAAPKPKSPDEVEATDALAAGEADAPVDETDADALDADSETSGEDAQAAPLDLEDRIAGEDETAPAADRDETEAEATKAAGEPEATQPDTSESGLEWEPADVPDLADTAQSDDNTILTGPWSAPAAAPETASAPEQAEDEVAFETVGSENDERARDDTAVAEDDAVAVDDAPDTLEQPAQADPGDTPVGALEWESVDAPEADAADAASYGDMAALAEAVVAEEPDEPGDDVPELAEADDAEHVDFTEVEPELDPNGELDVEPDGEPQTEVGEGVADDTGIYAEDDLEDIEFQFNSERTHPADEARTGERETEDDAGETADEAVLLPEEPTEAAPVAEDDFAPVAEDDIASEHDNAADDVAEAEGGVQPEAEGGVQPEAEGGVQPEAEGGVQPEAEDTFEPDAGAMFVEPLDEDAAAVAAADAADWEDAPEWEDAPDLDGAGIAAAAVGAAVAGMAVTGVASDALGDDVPDPVEMSEPEEASDLEGASEGAGGTPLPEEAETDTVIDEEMLRDFVAQLVRDELQGTVGERITHNVRRLIRREIARALTLRDFER